ncbi:MAG TPA: phage major capsid protein [Burkholderiales bacterium]|nr:phage major capsid protein [Burkholderiales bacterium]
MPSRYQALTQERADLIAEAEGLRALEDLTAEQDTRYSAIAERLTALGREIERERVIEDAARALPSHPDANQEAARPQVPDGEERFGYQNLAAFAVDVRNACAPGGVRSERLQRLMAAPSGYLQESGADEGYMVPPAFRQEIWDLVFDDPDILGRISPEQTNSNAVELLADESTPWGTAGIQASWRAEGAQLTASKVATKLRQVRLHELYAFVLATGELLRDAPRLNDRLTRGAAEAIRWKISEAIMFGDGAGQPLGWMNAACLVSVNRAVANQIATADVLGMFSRLLMQGGSRNVVWFANPATIPQLYAMTSGQNNVWFPPQAGFAGAPGGFLLGKPVVLTDHAQTLGTKGDLQLVDLGGYYATQQSSDAQFDTSIHLFFDYNIQAFRWIFRFGGEPMLSAAVSPAKGSQTRSHFIALN